MLNSKHSDRRRKWHVNVKVIDEMQTILPTECRLVYKLSVLAPFTPCIQKWEKDSSLTFVTKYLAQVYQNLPARPSHFLAERPVCQIANTFRHIPSFIVICRALHWNHAISRHRMSNLSHVFLMRVILLRLIIGWFIKTVRLCTTSWKCNTMRWKCASFITVSGTLMYQSPIANDYRRVRQ